MKYVHKVSLMIHTASYDNFLDCHGIKSYFKALLANLQRQNMHEFELIYVDTFYDENREKFDSYLPGLKFIVKHIPVHESHRYWYDKGYTYISAAKNTGILHADGELCITCDDAEFFPDDFIHRYWRHYKNGFLMLGMHNRMKKIKVHGDIPAFPLSGEIYVNDHRIEQVKSAIGKKASKTYQHTNGSWAFAGTSFGLVDALELNGFNEKMDGCKSLEDCDFGTRLQLIGKKFIQDMNGIFYIVDHPSYSEMNPTNWEEGKDCQKTLLDIKPTKKKIDNLIAIENYGMYRCGIELKETKANFNPITSKHLEIIKRETLHYRKFDPLSPDNAEKFEIWKNVPTFDLKKQREDLRKSPTWRW